MEPPAQESPDEDSAPFTQPGFTQTQVMYSQSALDAGSSAGTQPDEPEEQTHRFMLLSMVDNSDPIDLGYGETFSLGREMPNSTCSLTINDANISSKHLTITNPEPNVYQLVDSSSNGTFLDGSKRKIAKGTPVELSDGTEIVVKKPFKGGPKIAYVFVVYPKDVDLPPAEYINLQRKYKISFQESDVLGHGSFAKVYKGTSRCTNQLVAVKVVEKKKVSLVTSSRPHAIEDEFNILMKLKHPGVIQVYDVYDTQDKLYIVLERAMGGELFDQVIERPYSEQDAVHVFKQIVEAVKYLHDNGVVHRDIKPENVLIASKTSIRTKQVVKITDFGLSRLVGPQSFMQTLCGTPQYLAPEVITAQHSKEGYGMAIDMWSLGVILFILVSGTMPFAGPTESCPTRPPVQTQVVNGWYTFPEEDWSMISEGVKNLIRWLLTKEPERRATPAHVLEHSWMKGKKSPTKDELARVSDPATQPKQGKRKKEPTELEPNKCSKTSHAPNQQSANTTNNEMIP